MQVRGRGGAVRVHERRHRGELQRIDPVRRGGIAASPRASTALNPTGTGSSRPSPPVLPPPTPRLVPLHAGECPPPCTVVPSPLLAAPLPSSRVLIRSPVAAARVSGSWLRRVIGGARCGAAVCLFSFVDGEARDPGVEFPVPCS